MHVGTVSISHCLPMEVWGFTFLVILVGAKLGTRSVFLPNTKEVKLISTKTCFQLFTNKHGLDYPCRKTYKQHKTLRLKSDLSYKGFLSFSALPGN